MTSSTPSSLPGFPHTNLRPPPRAIPSPTISVASLVFQLLSFAACICPDSVIPYSSLLSTCSISADPPLLLPPCLSYACLCFLMLIYLSPLLCVRIIRCQARILFFAYPFISPLIPPSVQFLCFLAPFIFRSAVETPPCLPHPPFNHFLSLFWVLYGSKVYLGATVFCIHSYTYDFARLPCEFFLHLSAIFLPTRPTHSPCP